MVKNGWLNEVRAKFKKGDRVVAEVKFGDYIDFDTEEPQVQTPYFYADGEGFGWERIPLIAFRANRNELPLPLLKKVKSLQDGLKLMLSSYSNNMQEDCRNTILVLKNYDGENLGEFRQNLAAYGAVKVRTGEGGGGGVDTLRMKLRCTEKNIYGAVFY